MNQVVEDFIKKYGNKLHLYEFHFHDYLGDSVIDEILAKDREEAWASANARRRSIVNPEIVGITLTRVDGKDV